MKCNDATVHISDNPLNSFIRLIVVVIEQCSMYYLWRVVSKCKTITFKCKTIASKCKTMTSKCKTMTLREDSQFSGSSNISYLDA